MSKTKDYFFDPDECRGNELPDITPDPWWSALGELETLVDNFGWESFKQYMDSRPPKFTAPSEQRPYFDSDNLPF